VPALPTRRIVSVGIGCRRVKLLFSTRTCRHPWSAPWQDRYPVRLMSQLWLGGSDDAVIWEYAKNHDFTIVTKDSDYEQRSVLLGRHPRSCGCARETARRAILTLCWLPTPGKSKRLPVMKTGRFGGCLSIGPPWHQDTNRKQSGNP